jgi:hypothetical protein
MGPWESVPATDGRDGIGHPASRLQERALGQHYGSVARPPTGAPSMSPNSRSNAARPTSAASLSAAGCATRLPAHPPGSADQARAASHACRIRQPPHRITNPRLCKALRAKALNYRGAYSLSSQDAPGEVCVEPGLRAGWRISWPSPSFSPVHGAESRRVNVGPIFRAICTLLAASLTAGCGAFPKAHPEAAGAAWSRF